MRDIVIDTNVFLHAGNRIEKRSKSSLYLLTRLQKNSIYLCVDESLEPDRSFILCEYLSRLTVGSFGRALLAHLATSGRLKVMPRKTELGVTKKINKLIKNKADRVFLKVAYNSYERNFISHDYLDFQCHKRRAIKRELSINVIEAKDCLPLL